MVIALNLYLFFYCQFYEIEISLKYDYGIKIDKMNNE